MMGGHQRIGAESPVQLLQGLPEIQRFIVEHGTSVKPSANEPELP